MLFINIDIAGYIAKAVKNHNKKNKAIYREIFFLFNINYIKNYIFSNGIKLLALKYIFNFLFLKSLKLLS